jgi:hypothetical protein
VGGTAALGEDYQSLPTSVTIPAGQHSTTITIAPVDDPYPEPNETVTLTLTADPAYTLGSPQSATVSIADNDIPVTHVLTVGVRDEATNLAGDVAAQRVHDAFALLGSVEDNRAPLKLDSRVAGNYAALEEAIQQAGSAVKPGDTFVMYLASHGSFEWDGDEVAVQAQYDPSEPWARIPSTGDELIFLSRSGSARYMSDDEFSALFDNSTWSDVNKLFIIDTCYSGGHWGSIVLGDTGDLSRLSKSALIACAAEGDFGWTAYDAESQRQIPVFANALTAAVRSLSARTAISFADLYERINAVGAVFDGQDGRVLVDSPNPEDYWNLSSPIRFEPAFMQSPSLTDLLGGGIRPTAAPDLTGAVGRVSLPTTLLVGFSRFTLPVTVTNGGNAPLAAGQKIDIAVLAQAAESLGASTVRTVAAVTGQSVSGLKPGQSKLFNVPVTIPPDCPGGEYHLFAFIDSSHTVAESDETNNTVPGPKIAVAPAFVDLQAGLDDSKAPGALVQGIATKITVPVTVTNAGNTPVAKGGKVDVTLLVRPVAATDASADVSIGMLTGQSVSGLSPGKTQTLRINAVLPSSLAQGDYRLVAKIIPSAPVGDQHGDNDTAEGGRIIAIAIPFADLAAGLDDSKAPGALVQGIATKITVPVTVTNAGNTPVAKGGKVDVTLLVRPVAATDASADVSIGMLTGQSVSGLNPGKTQTLKINAVLPSSLAQGGYRLVAKIIPSDPVGDQHGDNDTAAGGRIITVTPPYVDLVVEIVRPVLPASVVSGDGRAATLPLSIANQGNVPVGGKQTIAVAVFARPAYARDDSADRLLNMVEGVSIAGLAPGASKTITLSATTPPGFAAGEYVLLAVADARNSVAEPAKSNNVAVTSKDSPMVVQTGYVDLAGAFGAITLPSYIVAGSNTTGKVPVMIRNDGSVSTVPKQSIDIRILARPDDATDNSQDCLLTTLTGQQIGGLKPTFSRTFTASVSVPVSLTPGNYHLVAVIDPSNQVDEVDTTNNTVVEAILRTVGPPPPDLRVVSTDLPRSISSGYDLWVHDTVKNMGPGPAAASTLAYYLSTDPILDSNDIRLAERYVPPLAAGASASGQTCLHFDQYVVIEGIQLYVLMVAEDGNGLQEGLLGESNNVLAKPAMFS